MLELKQNCKDNFLKLNLGDTLTVLTEDVDGDLITGYTENYLRVYLDASKVKSGEFVKVKITGAHKDGALGEIIN